MDVDRVLLIGLTDFAGVVRTADLFSDVNLHEISHVIWDPNQLAEELSRRFGLVRDKQNDFIEMRRANSALERRLKELAAWVSAGHAATVIARVPFYYYYKADQSYLYTDPWDQPPLSLAGARASTGKLIEFCGPEEAGADLSFIVNHPHYEVILRGLSLRPLLRVSSSTRGVSQLVGGYVRVGSGVVIFVPPPEPTAGYISPGVPVHQYWTPLLRLSLHLRDEGPPLPPWADASWLPEEAKVRREIHRVEQEIDVLRQQVDTQKQVVAAEEKAKYLFCGYGDEFTNAVKAALEALDLKVVHGPPTRADLLAWDGARLAAVEAKGLTGSAREKNVRQVEQWRVEVLRALAADKDEMKVHPELRAYRDKLTELGVPLEGETKPGECKGIMVIGTYRDTPLANRTERDFPDQVTRLAQQSSIAALTGLQLLDLSLQAKADPARRSQIRDELFATNGLVEGARDWREFLVTADGLPGSQAP